MTRWTSMEDFARYAAEHRLQELTRERAAAEEERAEILALFPDLGKVKARIGRPPKAGANGAEAKLADARKMFEAHKAAKAQPKKKNKRLAESMRQRWAAAKAAGTRPNVSGERQKQKRKYTVTPKVLASARKNSAKARAVLAAQQAVPPTHPNRFKGRMSEAGRRNISEGLRRRRERLQAEAALENAASALYADRDLVNSVGQDIEARQ